MYISSDSIQGTGDNLYNSLGIVNSNLRFKNLPDQTGVQSQGTKKQPSYKVYESNLAGSAFNDGIDKKVIQQLDGRHSGFASSMQVEAKESNTLRGIRTPTALTLKNTLTTQPRAYGTTAYAQNQPTFTGGFNQRKF